MQSIGKFLGKCHLRLSYTCMFFFLLFFISIDNCLLYIAMKSKSDLFLSKMCKTIIAVFCSLFIGASIALLHIEKNELYTDSLKKCKSMDSNSEIKKIFLVGKNQEVIKKEYFDKMPNLEHISMKDAANGIERNAFSELNVTVFECIGCNFTQLEEKFLDAPFMTTIQLHNCQIEIIKPGAFENFPVIQQAWISDNRISTIQKGVFTGTQFYMLYLASNQIEQIENGAFEDMTNLGYIELTNNLLTTFDASLIIGRSATIDILQLGQNKLQQVNKVDFSTLPALQFLNLTRNSLNNIKCCAFLENKNLTSLDLSHNKLKYIKPDMFCEDNRVKHLFLHDNHISYMDGKLISKLPKLENITTVGNCWYCSCLSDFPKIFAEANIVDVCESENDVSACKKDEQCKLDTAVDFCTWDRAKSDNCFSLFWRDVLFRK